MRFLIPAAIVCACLTSGQVSSRVSPADAQEREIVAKLLASEKDSDKAWGAVLAAKYKQPVFVPDILGLLDATDYRVRLAAIDALIAMEVDPPDAAMSALLDKYPEHFDAVLILMGRLPYLYRGFLEAQLNRSLTDWQWIMLNAVLAQSPGAIQASHLWGQWKLTIELAVADRGGTPRFRQAYGTCVHAMALFDPSFPQVSYQRLFEALTPSSYKFFVNRGPHRLIVGGDPSPTGGCYPGFLRQDYLRDYLEFLAGTDNRLPEAALYWQNVARFRTDAAAFLGGVRAYVADLRQRLIDSKLLSPQAALWPKLEVFVSDQRSDQSTPLPEFDWTFR